MKRIAGILSVILSLIFFVAFNACAAENLWFPHVACVDGWETEICILNTDASQTLNGVLKAYSNSGTAVSGEKIISLSPHARRQISVSDEFYDAGEIGYMVLDISSGSGVGYTKFYIEGLYRVAVPAVSEINSGDIYVPHIASDQEWWTGISLLNTTSAAKTFTFEFSNGTTKTETLSANEHRAFVVKSMFGGTTPQGVESAVIRNAAGVIGLELFGSSGESGNRYLSGILLKDELAAKLYYPHIASNNEWWTGIVTYNPSASACNLVITSYREDGIALGNQTRYLGGHEKYIGSAKDLGLPDETAWFSVSASSPVSGFELFGTNTGHQLAGYTGVNISGKSGVFAKREMIWDGWTGIAFVNIEESSANVTLTAYDDDGNAVDTEAITLNPHEKKVKVAEDLFSGNISAATCIGYVADREVVGFQLNGSEDGMLLDGLPGMMKIKNDDAAFTTGNQDFVLEEALSYAPLFGNSAGDFQGSNLPSRVDYSSYMPSVRNQGNTGSCTSWATGYYYKTYQEVIEEGWDKNRYAFSPMYLWAMQCKNFERPASFIASHEILKNRGCARWATVPYEDYYDDRSQYRNFYIPDSVHQEASAYRSGDRNPLTGLNQTKNALADGPVILGINYYDHSHLRNNVTEEQNYLRYDPGNYDGGHAILCVGYDDAKFGEGALLFINSWGDDWAIGGYSWIKYSDFNNIVIVAMTISDTPNQQGDDDNVQTRPDPPASVSASDAEGAYVDITWSKTGTALSYKIYRAEIGEPATYEAVGVSASTRYRDNTAEPGTEYYYSVVSLNDIGESEHYATDTSGKSYVDAGSARGQALTQPVLAWDRNDDSEIRSYFTVSNVDPSAVVMEVFVSKTNKGPWTSFGWIDPGDFYITWGEDSEYVGLKPFMSVRVANEYAYSYSEPAQVGKTIVTQVPVAQIQTLTAAADEGKIHLSWTTDGGSADFFEIWRYLASAGEENGNQWILVNGNIPADWTGGFDSGVLPGKSYYYAIRAVYQGTQSEYRMLETPVKIGTGQANLYLSDITYNYDGIVNPAEFDIEVYNDGDTDIGDYTIKIWAYDWDDQYSYSIAEFRASEVDWYGTLLPLPAGYHHTLSFTYEIPTAYADGHFYSWGIEIDPNNEIEEIYEEDNFLWSDKGWWLYGNTRKRNIMSASEKLNPSENSAALRPVSESENPNTKIGNTKLFNESEVTADRKRSRKENNFGPIRFKKPTFCIRY
ncbi:hypothetical protein DENIS_1294 [Desulfonema ishimotonii]|uniref:Fibronectin type-III domain-containing protein n=1 Tax=Desulfonema ishimotonii TaxID=45657 RepID=A0A401FTQ8_9BACT|nr:C1 family peptidase [Desulfonema ishimotonii]GBC60343.1 hypothetical protein DENIS_1294 [Desulfonema ishimotonii]